MNYSYTGFAAGQGDNSFPGSNIDEDLENLKASIDELIDFVALSIRSDNVIYTDALPEAADLAAYTAQSAASAADASNSQTIAAQKAAAAVVSASAASSSAFAAADSASSAVTTLAASALKANNLSDLVSAGTARTNLGLAPLLPPVGAVFPYAGSTEPSGYLFCYGQSLLRASYAALFTAIGTTYGAADGTHFSLPDLRGRVIAGKDDMGGSAAGTLNITMTGTRASTSNGVITALSSTANLSVGMKAFGTGIGAAAIISSIDSATQVTLSVNNSATGSGTNVRFGIVDGATLGDAGGTQTHIQTLAQTPSHQHTATYDTVAGTNTASQRVMTTSGATGSSAFNIGAAGGGQAHPNVQPTFILNYIIKT